MEVGPLLLHGLLLLAGVAAGFVNTVAGGGSLLTLPALMLLGLPAGLANGTNRLAILSQSLSGALAYRRAGRLDLAAGGPILLPALAGAACGALLASRLPDRLLESVLLAVLVLAALVMVLRPAPAAPEPGEGAAPRRARPAAIAGLFGAGLYGGFVQAGVGFVLLAVLGGLMRHDLPRANAWKLVCTSVFGGVALAVFALAGQVDWPLALLLSVATVVGSQLGVRFAVRARPRLLRAAVLLAVLASVAALLLRRL